MSKRGKYMILGLLVAMFVLFQIFPRYELLSKAKHLKKGINNQITLILDK